jgi:chromosome segregation ATPase
MRTHTPLEPGRVIEPALYFLLGFLSSGLLALIIAPAIWGRAVRLTRRRIEASQPLTLAEIRADRDQLRADFAVTSRRLELNIADLRTKAANQRIDVSRTLAERDEAIAERQRLATDIKIYQSELSTRGEGIAQLQDDIRTLQADLDQRNHLISGLELRVRELNSEINAHKLEIATLNTRLEAAGSASDGLAEARRLAEARVANLTAEIERRGAVIAEERNRAERLLVELQNLKKISRLPMPQSATLSQFAPADRDDNERPAISRLEAENVALEARARELAEERDKLSFELQAVKIRDLSTPADAADIGLLKERLGDIAARIATLAPIGAQTGPAETHIANAGRANAALPTDGDATTGKRAETLAEKIEALREAASNGSA